MNWARGNFYQDSCGSLIALGSLSRGISYRMGFSIAVAVRSLDRYSLT